MMPCLSSGLLPMPLVGRSADWDRVLPKISAPTGTLACAPRKQTTAHITKLAAATWRRTASSVASGSTQPRCTRSGSPQMEGPRQVTAQGSVTALLPAHPTPQYAKSQMPFAMPPLPPARSRAGQHHVPLLNDSFNVNPGGPASSAWQAPPMSFQPPPSVQPQLDEAAAVAHKQQTKPACPQDCQAPGAI